MPLAAETHMGFLPLSSLQYVTLAEESSINLLCSALFLWGSWFQFHSGLIGHWHPIRMRAGSGAGMTRKSRSAGSLRYPCRQEFRQYNGEVAVLERLGYSEKVKLHSL